MDLGGWVGQYSVIKLEGWIVSELVISIFSYSLFCITADVNIYT